VTIRPIPGDPAEAQVVAAFDLRDEAWLLSAPGDYEAAAVEVFKQDGSNYQRLVAVQWPARLNNGTERVTVRLLIAPEDAEGLAGVLQHTARWLKAAEVQP
jgi:hypothetical protein